ncbi:Flp pilus assembly protein TadG [Archangium gephyra]|uniref:Flp pilus assembly protein TadG n=2 Tax=Archangium gephyra TaxID=48 RepID=A0ABX9JVP4_9BACT|nr:pilus assembly protein TadG-related protein [Archangium gephyra]REG27925.1 Flp pilus assembly protein TadG [Archangium gephyra]
MRRRGQTLVVFALSLLLLVLMVTMTLSIGMKAKEKMELQTLADAAAYSNAVATARAFNSISLMNRALMGHMVAMTGVESLISWTGYYRGSILAASKAYDGPFKQYEKIALTACPAGNTALCTCANKAMTDITQTQKDLILKEKEIDDSWDSLDKPAGEEAGLLQLSSIWDEQQDVYKQLKETVIDGGLARSIVSEAKKGAAFDGKDLLVPDEIQVNKDELDGEWGCAGKGAACLRRNAGHKLHFIDAAMGSRGFSFVTARGAGSAIKSKLQTLLPPPDAVVNVSNIGSSYFPGEGQKSHAGPTIDGTEVWGDDHGSVRVTFGRGQLPCPMVSLPGSSNAQAHVRSNHLDDHGDQHVWEGGGVRRSDPDADERHTMGKCTQCPGIWPSHMDYNYNLVDQGADNWGQPKTYAVIQRNYKERPLKRADPWNLMFRFRFSPKKEGVEFDNRGIELSEANGGTDISLATALSAGITYYKREGPHWQEPPNFLNPFWRATLVSAHVDTEGRTTDVKETLQKAAPFAAEAYEALKKKEYKGW